MKQLIVLMASIILGLQIASLVAGPENSISSSLKELWTEEIELRTITREANEY